MGIIHVTSHYETNDPQTQRRQKVAKLTWQSQHWRERPIGDFELPRLYSDGKKRLPFIRDLFDIGIVGANPDDIVVFTNSDICVTTNASALIAAHLQDINAAYAFRRDFQHDFDKPIPDRDVSKGMDYAGSDLYAFRVQWWRDNRLKMPDMLLGREAWDAVLRHLVDETNPGKNCRLPDIIYHQRHYSEWEDAVNRYHLPSQLHNINLAKLWLRQHGINPAIHGLR